MSAPALSVVIPTWQRAETLAHTLQAVLREEADFEVVVVCDGEDAGVRKLSAQCSDPRVRWVFHETNLGLPGSRNTGAAHAVGEIVLFLDDDLEVTPGLLQRHAQAHDGCTKLAVQGRIVERAQQAQQTYTGRFLEQGWIRTLEAFADAKWANDGSLIPPDSSLTTWFGTNCSIRRELFLATKGFDPRLRASDEEMEFGYRLYMHGVRFQSEPEAIVFHRNAKDLVVYYRSCWAASGHLDVLRAMHHGDRSAQTRKLIAMDSGPYLSRLAHRTAWHCGEMTRAVASALEDLTEATGFRVSFRLWHEVSRLQQYWDAVHEEGVTRAELRNLAGAPARILLLHSIATPTSAQENTYYLSPARFRKLLDKLRAGRYRSIQPEALLNSCWGEKDFLLTFDDGYDDFYTEVFPLCAEYGLKPLVFLPAAHIGQSNVWDQRKGLRARDLLTLEQVREMQRYGVSFGSHTMTHPSLPSLTDAQLRSELCDSKKILEDLLGTEVSTFAYPCGEANRRVRAAVIQAGYKLAFSTITGWNTWEDPFNLRRTEFNETDAVASYGFKLRTGLRFREELKYQLTPLIHMIPGPLRRKLRAFREVFR